MSKRGQMWHWLCLGRFGTTWLLAPLLVLGSKLSFTLITCCSLQEQTEGRLRPVSCLSRALHGVCIQPVLQQTCTTAALLQPVATSYKSHLTCHPGARLCAGVPAHALNEGWLCFGWAQQPLCPLAHSSSPGSVSMLNPGCELCTVSPRPADPLHSLTFWIFLIWSESVSNRRVFRKSVTLATRPSM